MNKQMSSLSFTKDDFNTVCILNIRVYMSEDTE